MDSPVRECYALISHTSGTKVLSGRKKSTEEASIVTRRVPARGAPLLLPHGFIACSTTVEIQSTERSLSRKPTGRGYCQASCWSGTARTGSDFDNQTTFSSTGQGLREECLTDEACSETTFNAGSQASAQNEDTKGVRWTPKCLLCRSFIEIGKHVQKAPDNK